MQLSSINTIAPAPLKNKTKQGTKFKYEKIKRLKNQIPEAKYLAGMFVDRFEGAEQRSAGWIYAECK